jgi:hypothetical protein
LIRPPVRLALASRIVTVCPASRKSFAETNPAIPAPTIRTLFGLVVFGNQSEQHGS